MSETNRRRLDEALRALREEAGRTAAPARVESLLAGAFRRRRREQRRAQWVAGAIAALFLIAVSWLVSRPASPTGPVARPAPAVPGQADQNGLPVRAEFLPVAYAAPLRQGEPARVVAVDLPRTALLQFGLPVNPERMGERVRAHVLLGEDNLVRAIRLAE